MSAGVCGVNGRLSAGRAGHSVAADLGILTLQALCKVRFFLEWLRDQRRQLCSMASAFPFGTVFICVHPTCRSAANATGVRTLRHVPAAARLRGAEPWRMFWPRLLLATICDERPWKEFPTSAMRPVPQSAPRRCYEPGQPLWSTSRGCSDDQLSVSWPLL
eukprot:s1435_g14.t1